MDKEKNIMVKETYQIIITIVLLAAVAWLTWQFYQDRNTIQQIDVRLSEQSVMVTEANKKRYEADTFANEKIEKLEKEITSLKDEIQKIK